MKITAIINKSYKEQMRQFWLLVLTISMAPFFIFIYYLITESSKTSYDLLLMNLDKGVLSPAEKINHGDLLSAFAIEFQNEHSGIPLTSILYTLLAPLRTPFFSPMSNSASKDASSCVPSLSTVLSGTMITFFELFLRPGNHCVWPNAKHPLCFNMFCIL